MNTQRIDLDISKRDALTQMVTIGQGDASGTTIEATVYDNGAQVSLSGKSARFEMRLPDGKSYVRDTNCTVSGSKITYVVDEEHVGAVAGVTDDAYFDILDGATVIYSTNRFRMRILRSAHDGAQPAESWDSAVDDLIERGEAAIEDITKTFVPVSHGGTGATNAADALVNLGALGAISTQGPAYGPLLSVTAEGHAEQDGTPTPSDPKEIVVVRGRNLFGAALNKFISGSVAEGFALRNGGTSFMARVTKNTTYTIRDYSAQAGNRFRIVGFADEPSETISPNSTEIYFNNAAAPRQRTFNSGMSNWVVLTVDSQMYYSDAIAQLELGSTVHTYVPYGHVGLEVQGRNLLPTPYKDTSVTTKGITWTVNDDGSVTVNGTATGGGGSWFALFGVNTTYVSQLVKLPEPIKPGDIVTLSGLGGNVLGWLSFNDETGALISGGGKTSSARTYTVPDSAVYCYVGLSVSDGKSVSNVTIYPMLELGSTATDYEPYHHTTTPIPLPSRGWVGSLPDGTHDALSIDGAGKVTWELADAEVVLEGSEYWQLQNNGTNIGTNVVDSLIKPNTSNNTKSNLLTSHFAALTPDIVWVGNVVGVSISIQNTAPRLRFADGTGAMTVESWKTWLASNPVTVLYPLAAPTTEDMGYVDLPDIPDGAVVSMPELEGLGVESWTSDAVARYVRAWAARS